MASPAALPDAAPMLPPQTEGVPFAAATGGAKESADEADLIVRALWIALEEMSRNDQDASLRQFMEVGLARLQSHEQAYWEFLNECVLLASNNMQDL